MRIVITGGTGTIGRPLCAALATDGHNLTVLSRNPMEITGMPVGAHLHPWDAATTEGWGHLVDGADAVINLAGAGIADSRWSDSRKKLIRESRLRAGHAVVEAIQAAENKPKVLLQASAVGYYGSRGNEVITEDSTPGNDFLSKICQDWELSTAPVSRMGIRRPIIRTGIVLTMEGGALPKMVLPFRFFAGGPLGSGNQWMPWIHIDDQVQAMRFLLDNEQADGPFNLTAPNPLTNKEFAKTIGDVMGRPAVMPAPAFAMQTALGEMSTLLLDGQRALPQRLQDLGFEFTYPEAETALRDLLAD